ncbi:hypothetical protein TVAG_451960 [Trichomonas vaginalis G3]|uniref:Uncharacterized protein n=1 Tax=Trichomonas vaginalis (strain ATCC PRA-98 / G3) TaxID=412133 RepID=A2DJR8_TRIV3|nr:Nfx1-type zinc finger-containing protein family [Trichomonas vaginalis G3]EAY19282.1 hypothetical protein TVAG_451960 [Trichomonas vaginalis G3]KAI5527184.1 Nfx1-type zinc finger-containing protein family [Trichomonas vaginalis G3]|eukprot:XP_001580268.1 hypothetical protein [Trichomonas vaginalis G3]
MKQIGGNRSNGKNKPDGPSKTQECLKILDDLLKTDETELPSEIYEKRKLLEKCATWNDQSAGRIDIFVKFIELYTKQAVIQDPAIDRKENYTSIFFRRGKLVYDTDLEDFFMRIILKMVQIDKEKFIQFLDCISCSNIFQARTTLETIKKSLDIFEKKLKMETELPDMLKALKTKIEGFIESSENEKDSLQDFSIYPTSDNFFGSNPKVHNKAYDGFDSSEEQVNCLVKLEQLDFVYDIKKALQKYFTDKLDVRDIFLYHNVCMIPYSFHDPESIMKYEMFLHFEVFACPYWNIVLINDKLTKRLAFESLLFLSSTPQFHHIDAICYSRMPSKIQKNSSKEFIELF